jgi:hypothetical protein
MTGWWTTGSEVEGTLDGASSGLLFLHPEPLFILTLVHGVFGVGSGGGGDLFFFSLIGVGKKHSMN